MHGVGGAAAHGGGDGGCQPGRAGCALARDVIAGAFSGLMIAALAVWITRYWRIGLRPDIRVWLLTLPAAALVLVLFDQGQSWGTGNDHPDGSYRRAGAGDQLSRSVRTAARLTRRLMGQLAPAGTKPMNAMLNQVPIERAGHFVLEAVTATAVPSGARKNH